MVPELVIFECYYYINIGWLFYWHVKDQLEKNGFKVTRWFGGYAVEFTVNAKK